MLIILCQCLLRTGAGEGSLVFPHGYGETVTRVSARVRGDGHLCFSSGVGRRSPVFQLRCGVEVTRVSARVRGDGHPCFCSGAGRRHVIPAASSRLLRDPSSINDHLEDSEKIEIKCVYLNCRTCYL